MVENECECECRVCVHTFVCVCIYKGLCKYLIVSGRDFSNHRDEGFGDEGVTDSREFSGVDNVKD